MNINIFRGKCSFIAAFSNNQQIVNHPSSAYLQVGFIGRSNVGKSSTINALLGRKNFVRFSKTPGRTQTINFFNLEDEFMLVDMPGYGYASISKKEKARISDMIADYLQTSYNLKRVYLILDARFGIKDNDLEMMNMLDSIGVSYQIALNKCDKISKTQLDATLLKMQEELAKHPACYDKIITYSAHKKTGIENFKNQVISVITDSSLKE